MMHTPKTTRERSRRVRIYPIEEQALVDLLRAAMFKHPEYVLLPKLDLPDGYVVEQVTHSFERMCWLVMVSHESFPEVSGCGPIPFEQPAQVQHVVRLPLQLPAPVVIGGKIECPLCGATNRSTNTKCHYCKRPLPSGGSGA